MQKSIEVKKVIRLLVDIYLFSKIKNPWKKLLEKTYVRKKNLREKVTFSPQVKNTTFQEKIFCFDKKYIIE